MEESSFANLIEIIQTYFALKICLRLLSFVLVSSYFRFWTIFSLLRDLLLIT